MNVKVKPIQPTPVLSGIDAQQIIAEVKNRPSETAIAKNRTMLAKVKKAMNKK